MTIVQNWRMSLIFRVNLGDVNDFHLFFSTMNFKHLLTFLTIKCCDYIVLYVVLEYVKG